MMKEWEIWREGYAVNEEFASASLEGKYIAESFDDAVELYLDQHPDLKKYHEIKERYLYGTLLKYRKHYIWGCGLYENEADARRFFG